MTIAEYQNKVINLDLRTERLTSFGQVPNKCYDIKSHLMHALLRCFEQEDAIEEALKDKLEYLLNLTGNE